MFRGIHDPGLRDPCALHLPWEVRIAGRRRAPSLQLYWPDLELSLLMPSALNHGFYDCSLQGHRWRCHTWRQTVASLGPIGGTLPSLARLRAWSRWHAFRSSPRSEGPSAPVIPLRRHGSG
ncbi:MAG: hypothetical protein JJ863_19780 [Deltaproteobacteria bacterium]|nr:hypothetical protein [Deltaproteobacteria bacterium]